MPGLRRGDQYLSKIGMHGAFPIVARKAYPTRSTLGRIELDTMTVALRMFAGTLRMVDGRFSLA